MGGTCGEVPAPRRARARAPSTPSTSAAAAWKLLRPAPPPSATSARDSSFPMEAPLAAGGTVRALFGLISSPDEGSLGSGFAAATHHHY